MTATFNDTGHRGQSNLTVVQAVEVALQPVAHKAHETLDSARLDLQERMIAELVAVLRENQYLNDDDVLRLIGKFRFEIA